jgi:hypothetical protein
LLTDPYFPYYFPYKSLKSNGLIAALAEVVLDAPEISDAQLVIDLVPFVSWKHAIKRLLSALTKLAECGQLSADQMENVIKLVLEHPLACQPHVDSLVKDLLRVIETQLGIGTGEQQQSIKLWEKGICLIWSSSRRKSE